MTSFLPQKFNVTTNKFAIQIIRLVILLKKPDDVLLIMFKQALFFRCRDFLNHINPL